MLTYKTLIVSFAGHGLMYGGVPKIEFSNFLKQHFSYIDAQFYVDYNCKSYHQGLRGISNNIDETVVFLKDKLKHYERVICLGASAGGYAAILFGSLLNVDTVIAFIPQTKLRSKERDEKYRDIAPYINTTTKYHIFGDISIHDENNCHHITQCERIAMFSNVHLSMLDGVNLAVMRNNGLLLDIMTQIIGEQVATTGNNFDTPIKERKPYKFPQLQRFLPKRYF